MKELNLILLCGLSLVTLFNFALAISIRRGQRRADREHVQRALARQQTQGILDKWTRIAPADYEPPPRETDGVRS